MLSLSKISVVKNGGSRQMNFTDEEGEVYEFHLRKITWGDESKSPKQTFTALFKGNMTGPDASKAQGATSKEIQMVCEALERWSRLHDAAQYRELKARWDELTRRLEQNLSGDNN
ncbi:hypothetical protein BH11VER1_BH11VER1_02410 [soil metagenome]